MCTVLLPPGVNPNAVNEVYQYHYQLCHATLMQPPPLRVECHPYLSQNNLIEFCRKNGIRITACSPLGGPTGISPLRKGNSPQPLTDPKIRELAGKHGKTSAQIILIHLVSLKEEFRTLRSEGFYKTQRLTSADTLIWLRHVEVHEILWW